MAKITVDPEKIKAPEPLPEGLYKVRLEGFKPKKSQKGTSINLNPQCKVVEGQYANRPIWPQLNSSADWIINDFVHAFGLEMQKEADGSLSIPGNFDGPQDEPEKWNYKGPLANKVAQVLITTVTYDGKPQNKVKAYLCSVPDCNTKNPGIRHSTDLK